MGNLASQYKAELLVRPSLNQPITGIAVNGGCQLGAKCAGTADYLAEQIQMGLPNGASITAYWIPKTYANRQTYTAAFAGYNEPNGDNIRFDNAHQRGILHLDSQYRGRTQKHKQSLSLPPLKVINRRRVALIELLRVLETNVDWRAPIWFYMPWCMWWEQDRDFPDKLRQKKPTSIPVVDFCEAVLAYVSLESDMDSFKRQPHGVAKITVDVVDEAADRVAFDLNKFGQFEYQAIVFGHTTILPFLMYAPPGASIQGPPDIVNPLLIN